MSQDTAAEENANAKTTKVPVFFLLENSLEFRRKSEESPREDASLPVVGEAQPFPKSYAPDLCAGRHPNPKNTELNPFEEAAMLKQLSDFVQSCIIVNPINLLIFLIFIQENYTVQRRKARRIKFFMSRKTRQLLSIFVSRLTGETVPLSSLADLAERSIS
jgi:hypothetical protein